jgi:molecular chaperone HtpG
MNAEAETIAQTHPFQAEVAELLHLMVHAVYSETDVFLRELISNAPMPATSCATRRSRSRSCWPTARRSRSGSRPTPTAGTLAISDTGIGMDRQELIDNLGTVARSGTRAFVSRLQEAKDGAGLIGQFGVGFYSAFMVADRIEVDQPPRRRGRGLGLDLVGRRRLRDRAGDRRAGGACPARHRDRPASETGRKRYLEPFDIERIVKTYSDHILFPIELAGAEGAPRQINAASAIWQRPKSELHPEDYKQAYRSVTGAFDEPAMTLHYRAEGRSRTRSCCSRPRASRSTCSIPTARAGSGSTCAGSTSATMPTCCRPICASCAA